MRSDGGLLPPDLLRRLLHRHSSLAGTRPEDYGLSPGERLNQVITHSRSRLRRHYGEYRAAAANLHEGAAATGLTNDKWSLPLRGEGMDANPGFLVRGGRLRHLAQLCSGRCGMATTLECSGFRVVFGPKSTRRPGLPRIVTQAAAALEGGASND